MGIETIKYYSDTSIPMPRFIDLVEGDMKALLKVPIERELTNEELEILKNAALQINSDYIQQLGDVGALTYTSRVQTMADIGKRLVRLRMAVASLRLCPSLDMIEILKEEYPEYEYNPAKAEQFEQELQNVLTELVADEIEYERLQKQEEKEQENKQKDSPMTRQGFTDHLFEINHQEGVKYTIEDLTLRDFASLIKRLKMHYSKPPKAVA